MHAALTVAAGGRSRCTQLLRSHQEVAVDARNWLESTMCAK